MHIDYYEPSTGEKMAHSLTPKAEQVKVKRQGVWPLMRFVVVTGLIFAITFFAVNFSAYKDIMASVINPDGKKEAQALLEESAQAKVDPDKLLPTLADQPETQKEYAWLNFPIAPTDNRLIVPKLGVNVPIVEVSNEHIEGENWGALEEQIQTDLKKGVALYPKTARPGEYGNTFITGHSSYYAWDDGKFKDVFALLHKLEIGDTYYIYYKGRQHTYKVYDKYEVYPDNVSVLEQPADEKISTLMTCTPIGTTLRRLVINARDITDEGKSGPKLPALT